METEFFPSKRIGLVVILVLCLLLTTLSAYLLFNASTHLDAQDYSLKILAGVVLFIPWTLLVYRAYELITMGYTLSRGGLVLHWGLHREVIPMPELAWIRPVSDFKSKLPLPFFQLPGSFLGKKQVNGLGLVEFAATDKQNFLLVAARTRYYVISPQDSNGFVHQFDRLIELGTFEPLQAHSESFATLWKRVWLDRIAQRLILIGLGAASLLLGLTAVLAAGRANITWIDLGIVPSQRLFLLGILGMFVWFVDLLSGLFFYLRGNLEKSMIYILWATSIITSLILIIAMVIMSI